MGPSFATYLRSWQGQGRRSFRGVVSAVAEPAQHCMRQVCTWPWQGRGFRSVAELKEWYLVALAFARVGWNLTVADSWRRGCVAFGSRPPLRAVVAKRPFYPTLRVPCVVVRGEPHASLLLPSSWLPLLRLPLLLSRGAPVPLPQGALEWKVIIRVEHSGRYGN